MIRARTLVLASLALAGCPSNSTKPAEPGAGAELVSQARAQLADRERKLTAYRFHGLTTDLASGESLGYRFVYRSPGKMRGETEGKAPHVIAFDGQALRDLDVGAKKLTTFDLAGLPREKADAFLHNIFAPFSPEGFRAPLLPSGKELRAEQKTGEADRPELALTADLVDGADHYAFTFRFTTPAMDLVDKQIHGPEGDSRVQVVKQNCEPKLGLCFPTEILESQKGQPSARTLISELAINGPTHDEEFTLAVPAGGTEEKRALASAPQ